MKVAPLDDKVLVRRGVEEAVSRGGIVLPDSARGRAYTARVLAVGPGRLSPKTGARSPIPLSPGDEVILKRHVGKDVKIEGELVTMVEEADVLAVIEK